MKGYINGDGELLIYCEFRGGYRHQSCIYDEECYCGDWCPHFGDHVFTSGGMCLLKICQGRELAFEYSRERPK